jgi:hypothetical protein
MPLERKLNVSLSMKIKGESTIVGMDPMATHYRKLIVAELVFTKWNPTCHIYNNTQK